MANNYLDFSEVIAELNPEEENWLRSQLETVHVFGDREYPENQVPGDLDSCKVDWIGCRAYRDIPDCAEYARDMGMEGPGFEYSFDDDRDTPDCGRRHLWIHAGEWGYVNGATHLVRKFLKRFRPDQCWSLTYATNCSKPRVGEFGGGAVFVTADEIRWRNAYDFVEQQRAAFQRHGKPHPGETNHGETAATEP
ncbi:MAG: hypothetical protein ACLQNE_22330 [Thermoguttaceae bacterium]